MGVRIQVPEAEFIRDWETGVTTAAMGTKYGISDSTVSKHARRLGLDARASRWHREKVRPITHPSYALSGGDWVPRGGVMVWQPRHA